MEQLPNISHLGGETFLVRRYAMPNDKTWSAFNPSIQRDEHGTYWMVFRSSNYFFDKNWTIGLTTSNKVRNRLFIGKVDPITLLIEEETLKEVDMRGLNRDIQRGFEDARLFFDGKDWCLSATYLEKSSPIARICLVRLESLENPRILSLDILPAPIEKRPEKNWMPVHVTKTKKNPIINKVKVKHDFLYDSKTFISSGVFSNLKEVPAANKLRGGSQILALGDGTSIGVVHECYSISVKGFNPSTMANQTTVRQYSHRFIRLDEKYNIIQMSDRFVFVKEGIEFAAGLAPYKDGFIISFGRQDIASYVATISLGHLLLTLKDV